MKDDEQTVVLKENHCFNFSSCDNFKNFHGSSRNAYAIISNVYVYYD